MQYQGARETEDLAKFIMDNVRTTDVTIAVACVLLLGVRNRLLLLLEMRFESGAAVARLCCYTRRKRNALAFHRQEERACFWQR